MPAANTAASIDPHAIRRVHSLIEAHVRRTPVINVRASDFGLPASSDLTLKLELLQHAGSFKSRGAFANLLTRAVPAAGIAAASGGNHGAAVAYAAGRLGIPATIFVPEIASAAKIAAIRDFGATLVVGGARYVDALGACQRHEAETGALGIHAYDAVETLLGQGTIGLELEAQAPDIDTLLISVGGGGLIAGAASWYRGRVRIVGVEPQTSRALHAALAAGKPVDVDVAGVAADSLGARRVGDLVYPIAREFVDRVVLVSDDAIRDAQLTLWRSLRVVAEPGGAAALAALTSGAYRPAPDERVGVLVCGGNTTAVDFAR